jgi:peptidoglycan hydrolase CwlO-like protein
MKERPQYFFERVTAWIGSTSSFVVHTVVFAAVFGIGYFGWADWDTVLLVLTTVVSLEAIYLAIFIQMTVNRQTVEIQEVSEDVEEIQEDIQEISEDVDEISEDIDEIQEDVDEIQEDVEEISEDWDLETGEKVTPTPVTVAELTEEIRGVLKKLEALQNK